MPWVWYAACLAADALLLAGVSGEFEFELPSAAAAYHVQSNVRAACAPVDKLVIEPRAKAAPDGAKVDRLKDIRFPRGVFAYDDVELFARLEAKLVVASV